MLANPGGTFMYTVWNQWQEEILPDGHELIFDSDIWFRRLLYLPDDSELEINPVASILYVNSTILSLATDDSLMLVGSAKGFGSSGEIEETVWLVKPLGAETEPVVIGTEKMLQLQAAEIINQLGLADGNSKWVEFTFKAKDKGGRWSPGVTVQIWIVDELHQVFLPMTMNEP
ncbi:MAG: hypothetical protein IAF02_09785 [Anaerolineae bacterium]|nr:hypothetical protein [Anaerolineae bacterium]